VIKLWRKTNNSVATITKTVIPTTTSESNRRKKTTDSKRKRSSGIGVVLEEVGSSHPNENFSHSGEATTTTTSSITKKLSFSSLFPSRGPVTASEFSLRKDGAPRLIQGFSKENLSPFLSFKYVKLHISPPPLISNFLLYSSK